jgi:hypothetical protein
LSIGAETVTISKPPQDERILGKAWKVSREIRGLVARLVFLFVRPLEILRLKCGWIGSRMSIAESKHGISSEEISKVAIFVVYRPGVMPDSVRLTVSHLADHGYAVCVVANGGLSLEGKAALSRYAWVVIERPNFGRDFAAYQEGIQYLRSKVERPVEVLLINDSIIFPMKLRSQVLENISSSKYQVVSLFGASPEIKAGDAGKYGMLSFFIWHSSEVSVDPRFLSFWRQYKPSNFKHYTLRCGEQAYSKHLAGSGFSCASLCNPNAGVARLNSASNNELVKILKHATFQDRAFHKEHAALMEFHNLADTRDKMIAFISKVINRRPIAASFPYLVVELMAIDCVKRGSTPLQRNARNMIGRMVSDGTLTDLDPCVGSELCGEGYT